MTNASMRVVFAREFPELPAKIKAARVASKQSLTQLAATAGISVPHWHRIEKDQVKDLPVETLRGIEKALDADFEIEED